jgi:hypothetical protein
VFCVLDQAGRVGFTLRRSVREEAAFLVFLFSGIVDTSLLSLGGGAFPVWASFPFDLHLSEPKTFVLQEMAIQCVAARIKNPCIP